MIEPKSQPLRPTKLDQGGPLKRRGILFAAFPLLLTGCASGSPVARDPDGSFCYRSKLEHYIKGPCITEGVPSLQDDALVKQLPAHPTLLTVYVVRQNLADGQDVIKVVADDVTTISTLPDTIARLRFKPGEHTLSFLFEEQRGSVEVEGQAGEVRFVRLRGVGFAWAVRYDWMHSTAQATRKKVWRARLIADVLVP